MHKMKPVWVLLAIEYFKIKNPLEEKSVGKKQLLT